MKAPIRLDLKDFAHFDKQEILAKFPKVQGVVSTPQAIAILRFACKFRGMVTVRESKSFGRILGIYNFHGLGPEPRPVVLSKKAQRWKAREEAARKANENVIK